VTAPQPEQPTVDLRMVIEHWGVACRLAYGASSITIDFHDDGGIEVKEPDYGTG
jgi:hypothetical protein